jgi:hypothetical protein
VEVDRNILSDGFHHALHRGMLPVLDLESGERLIGTNLDGNKVEVRGCDFYRSVWAK